MTVRFANPNAPNLFYARGKISMRADGRIRNVGSSAQLGPLGTGTAARQETEEASPGITLRGGTEEFESPFLQRRVRLSPASAFEGREPRLSARVSAAG
jgi:hypothetical protein